MMRGILDLVMSGDPVSADGRRSGERSVTSHIPSDARGRKSAGAPVTEVVPSPSVCSTAVGPPRRTFPLSGRRLPLTLVPPVGGRSWCG